MPPRQVEQGEDVKFADYVVKVRRTAKVIKGGRRFSFSALVIVGNRRGEIGMGFGKANEVPQAVQKAVQRAGKHLMRIPVADNTIPHCVVGRCGASRILLMPARPGTGIIACASVRAVVEAVGIKDILSKAHGSTNAVNLTKATLEGLKQLRSKQEVMALRGVELK